MTKQTIEAVVKDDLCTGCGTCVGICPSDALEMVIDERKGIYIPILNRTKCNKCGICFTACPGHEVDFQKMNKEIFGREPEDILIGHYLNCYTGYSTDYNIRYTSSSGGMVTQLLIFALQEGIIDGALVTRMKKDNPLEPEPFIARTEREIMEAQNSKYCPVPANIALKEILKIKGKYAVVGLPCHIHGIRKLEQINNKLKDSIILHIGIICANTRNFWGTEYFLRKKHISKQDIKFFHYRGEGWPGKILINKLDDSKVNFPYPEFYDNTSAFTPWRCSVCIDNMNELADIAFGDAWLPELKASDKIGTSLIIVKNEQSQNILQKMLVKEKINLSLISLEKTYQTQGGLLSSRKSQLESRLKVSKLFFKKAPSYSTSFKFKARSISTIKAILLYSQSILASRTYLYPLFIFHLKLTKIVIRIKSMFMHY